MILFNELDYPILSKEICWGPITAKFEFKMQLPDEKLISNVSLIPFIEDKCVIMQINNTDWELPGGTLEPSEHWFDAVSREAMEELGAKLINFNMFGAFYCKSVSENPYRPHIPHPNFLRVEVVDIQEAMSRFENMGRYDIAELYKIANKVRG
jgi:8-oxo-dGTP diphosphatase